MFPVISALGFSALCFQKSPAWLSFKAASGEVLLAVKMLLFNNLPPTPAEHVPTGFKPFLNIEGWLILKNYT